MGTIRVVVALIAALVLLPAVAAAGQPDASGKYLVGHATVALEITGSQGERRPVDIHFWFPADNQAWDVAPAATYTSRLNGVTLDPTKWDPLSWKIVSPTARSLSADAVQRYGEAFPVVIFSAGNLSAPIDLAYTMEHVASHGYIGGAPHHTRNDVDDARVDFINSQAGFPLLACLDGRPAPCSEANAGRTLQNRVLDLGATLDVIPSLFGARADTSRVAALGYSRGTVTSLILAGGSTPLGITADSRIDLVLGFGIGAPAIMRNVNLSAITVPTLLVAGDRDRNTPATTSEAAIGTISSTDKALVILENVQHRHFSGTFCDTTQVAGSIAQSNSRAILDFNTVSRLALDTVNGTQLDWCSYGNFVSPDDIRPLMFSLTGFAITESNVPRDGIDVVEVDRLMRLLIVSYLDAVLDVHGNDGIHYTLHLAPKFLLKHESSVGRIELWTGEGAICPPGQCED